MSGFSHSIANSIKRASEYSLRFMRYKKFQAKEKQVKDKKIFSWNMKESTFEKKKTKSFYYVIIVLGLGLFVLPAFLSDESLISYLIVWGFFGGFWGLIIFVLVIMPVISIYKAHHCHPPKIKPGMKYCKLKKHH